MVECIDALSLSVAIVHVFLHIEAVHVDKGGWLALLEQFLFERVAVLSVIDDDLTVGSTD